jgi:hypothetical protein
VLVTAAVVAAVGAALGELRTSGDHPPGVPRIAVQELFRQAGADRWDAIRAQYAPPIEEE